MRSVNRAALVVALATVAAGCGNYSTEDLRFLSALPHRDDLAVTVPTNTGAGPAALTGLTALSATCASSIGDAEVWKWAKPTSDNLNTGVSWIIGLIDAVRQYSPTYRNTDSRRWGPFDAERHPGREIQVVIDRSWPNGQDGTPTYAYRFEARVKGTTPFTPLIWGTFVGASASHGDGDVTLDFDAFWTVGVNELDTPHGRMTIRYSRSSDPVTTDLDLRSAPAGGFGAVSFGYGYAGYAAGGGAFDYAFQNVFGERLEVWTNYDAAGAGGLAVRYYPSGATISTGSFRQCWDANACLVFVDDPLNLSCGVAPCSAGSETACLTAIPVPP
jgi:hypothetical protein